MKVRRDWLESKHTTNLLTSTTSDPRFTPEPGKQISTQDVASLTKRKMELGGANQHGVLCPNKVPVLGEDLFLGLFQIPSMVSGVETARNIFPVMRY